MKMELAKTLAPHALKSAASFTTQEKSQSRHELARAERRFFSATLRGRIKMQENQNKVKRERPARHPRALLSVLLANGVAVEFPPLAPKPPDSAAVWPSKAFP
jgi:hypothetical protein